MECFAGLATAGAAAKTTFDYNRDNFMYDRDQRLKKEFALQKFRIAQASLWREDVRDLISLSEYKMHIYLLVNVLLLGFTIVLWCEGRLPSDTPDWLMMGSALSITGAFMFLLLSMWLAMHAAVAAQSYEARLLTQLVRLPIPSWEEMEACRTYGSDYERVGAKQMLRVPFVTGRQEGLVSTAPEAAPPPAGSAGSPPTGAAGAAAAEQEEAPRAVDPWGYERSGEDIYELGCSHGSQVAKLRHIKLARQAMVYWQSYDAFSRISLSIGINQVLLALSYYILGYILVEVGCRTAATYGVVLLCVLAEAMTKLDMSLSIWQLRQIQFLLAFGPIMALVASYRWTLHSFESYWFAETLIVLSFFSHGLLIALMMRFCFIKPQDNGTMLPTAFRGVLYLDVFGWVRQSPNGDVSSPGNTLGAPGSPIRRRMRRTSTADSFPDIDAAGGPSMASPPAQASTASGADSSRRPALETITSASGKSVPRLPQDLAPKDAVQDMRDLPGAPHPAGGRPASESLSKFYDAEFWLSGEADGGGAGEEDEERTHRDFAPIVTGHEKEVPRVLPWRIFSTFAMVLSCAYILAALYHILGATKAWDFDIPIEREAEEMGESDDLLAQADARPRSSDSPLLSLLSMSRKVSTAPKDYKLPSRPLHLSPAWPHPNVKPIGMSCDAAGNNFVVTDGLVMYSAKLNTGAGSGTSLRFAELRCPTVAGEGLQDVALACPRGRPGDCKVHVLHRHGRRLAACALNATAAAAGPPGAGSGSSLGISEKWLEQMRVQGGEANNGGSQRVRAEKAVTVSADARCAESSQEGCTFVGTTYGRVVRLGRQSDGLELLPTEVVRGRAKGRPAGPAQPGRGRLGSLGGAGGRLGVLEEADGKQSVLVLDAERGGASRGRLLLPQASAAVAFCSGGGYLYLLLQGPSPEIARVPLPREMIL